ncbi:MAG: hypothetical protein WKF75_02705, partial [Singulisphaera sp.]
MDLREIFNQPADFLPMGLIRTLDGLSGFVTRHGQEVAITPYLLDPPPSGVSLLASGFGLLTKPLEIRSDRLALLVGPANRGTEPFERLLVLGVRSLPIVAAKPFGFLLPRETPLFPLRMDRMAIRLPAPATLLVFASQAIEIRLVPGRCLFQRVSQLLNGATMDLRLVLGRPELVLETTELGAGFVALLGDQGEAFLLLSPHREPVAEVVPFNAEPIALGVGRLEIGLP